MHSFFRSSTPGLLLVLVTLASGCTLGPDYQRPTTAADGVAFIHAPVEASPHEEITRPVTAWWRGFADAWTSELVEAALVANTDLRIGAARVLEARAALRQSGARLLPEVHAGAGASRQKNSFVLPNIGRVSPISTTYSDSLSAAYQVDLFGGLRRGREAAWAELLAQQAARDTVIHTVIAEVVRGRVRLDTLTRSLDIAQATRDSWARTFATIDRRHRLGLASSLDLRLARENLSSAEAAVVDQERQLEQARLALDVLLGRRPGSGELAGASLDPLPDLRPVPVGLPIELLERRPDVREAELRLKANTARVGVALADLFPGLTLSGSAGNSSDELDDLLSSTALVYNAVANLAAPLFDGGRRRASVRAARARVEVATASYAGAVLRALREVEDALVREAALRRRLEFLDQRVEDARFADRMARGRYERGVENLLAVLDSERRWRAAEDALLRARADLWHARIDLHLALGGDWLDDSAATINPTPREDL